jgi:hypothetical protein
MNQMHRNRIWEMIIKSLSDKNRSYIPKDDEQKKQIIDPEEIMKGFKESIQKSTTDRQID